MNALTLEPPVTIDTSVLEILRCPESGQRLVCPDPEGDFVCSLDGKHRYEVVDGVFIMLPATGDSDVEDPRAIVRSFYENFGWEEGDDGVYNDTRLFMSSNSTARSYTSQCMLSINNYLPRKGRYLLDAGSGPIPHTEYESYHKNFYRRVCVDFSLSALLKAKRKLGERGIYIVGDLTKLPLIDGAVDAVVCCHVLYHVPENQQRTAMEEVSRVLAPHGVGVVIYRWEDSPLSWRVERILMWASRFDKSSKLTKTDQKTAIASKPLYFHPHPREWLFGQAWPFHFRLACFRVIDNHAMQTYFTESWIWKGITSALYIWQQLMPGFTGKYGLYPIILITK